MITLYTTKTCAYCPMVKKYLTFKKSPFNEIDVTDNMDLRKRLLKTTGMSTVPVTTNGTDFVVGWNPAKLALLISS